MMLKIINSNLQDKEQPMDPCRLHRKGFADDAAQDIFNTLNKEIENEKSVGERLRKKVVLKYLQMFIEWYERVSSLKDTPYKITPLYLIGAGDRMIPEYFLEELVYLYNQWIFAVYTGKGISIKFKHFASHDCSFTPVENMPFFGTCACGTDDFFIAGSPTNYLGKFGRNMCLIKFERRIIDYIDDYFEKRHNQLFIDVDDGIKEVDETNCHYIGSFDKTYSHVENRQTREHCSNPNYECDCDLCLDYKKTDTLFKEYYHIV